MTNKKRETSPRSATSEITYRGRMRIGAKLHYSGEPLSASTNPALAVSGLAAYPTLLSLAPFTTIDNEWVTLLDDGDPKCDVKTVTNTSQQPMLLEVTWTDGDSSLTKSFVVPPTSSIIIECNVSKLRITGGNEQTGNWRREKKPPQIQFLGSGTVFRHGGEIDKPLVCRTFEIRNAGRKPIKIHMRRAAPGGVWGTPDEDSTLDVHPDNILRVRCEIVRLEIERESGDESGLTQVKEVRE